MLLEAVLMKIMLTSGVKANFMSGLLLRACSFILEPRFSWAECKLAKDSAEGDIGYKKGNLIL